MFARLALNMAATFTPLYLKTALRFEDPDGGTSLAISLVPFCSYILSFIVSTFVVEWIIRTFRNRFIPMMFSMIVSILGFGPLYFLEPNDWTRNLVYPLAALQGCGIAIMLNTSTSLISDVIGKDNTSSAFVYGIYSLFDKFANGLLGYWLIAEYSK